MTLTVLCFFFGCWLDCGFLVTPHDFLNIHILTFIFNSDMEKKNIEYAYSSHCMCEFDFSGIL